MKKSDTYENDDYSLDIRQEDCRYCVTVIPKKPLTLIEAVLTEEYDYPMDASILVNGYQSWTDTGEFSLSDELHSMDMLPEPLLEKYHFRSYGDAWFKKYKKGRLHGYTFGYVKDGNGITDLIGSLNEEKAYLIINYIKDRGLLRLESDCSRRNIDRPFCLFDFVRYTGNASEVLKKYFARFGTCDVPKLRGYTSWYLDYQNINEEKLTHTLASVDSEHFELFQIDDGYETFIGDWKEIDTDKFPNGLAPLVEKIHEKGLKAGIWIAPFVCETQSRVFKNHPDWVYKDNNGALVYAGSNWSGFMPLDIRKAVVREYIKECLKMYKDMGFDFFKLDFLYAAALVRTARHTRAEVMRRCMKFLREELRGKLILGCGVPLSSAFGLVDYCRIGPDVSLKFDDIFYMRFMHRERISTKKTLVNTIYRSCMDGYVFRCDPDVFLLRDDHIELSKEQRLALVTLNHLCGSVYMTSDDVGQYDAEKKAILAEAEKLTRSEITDIRKDGNYISIKYLLDQKEYSLTYNSKKGILVRSLPGIVKTV